MNKHPDPDRADRFISRPGEVTIHRAPGKPPMPDELDTSSARASFLGVLRREAGLTQAELGERLGIDQGGVSRLERRRDLKLSTMLEYLAALDVGDVDLTVTLAGETKISVPLARAPLAR